MHLIKEYRLFLWAFLVSIILAIKQFYAGLGNWIFSQYLINYEIQFLKRGLLGELLRLLNGGVTVKFVHIFSVISLIIFIAIFSWKITKPAKKNQKLFWFSILALTSPATINHFIWDTGRFDITLLVLFFINIWLIDKKRNSLTFILSTLIFLVMLLIHEVAFFMFIPPLIMFWIYLEKKISIYPVLLIIISFISTYLISTLGLLSPEVFGEYFDRMVHTHGIDWVKEGSLGVIRDGSLGHNSSHTLGRILAPDYLFYHIIFVIFLYPFLYLLFNQLKAFHNKDKWAFILVLSSFSSLALYPLGTDLFRWWSVALTVYFILVTYLLLTNDKIEQVISVDILRRKKIYIFACILALITGPLKLGGSFSISSKLEKSFVEFFQN